MEAGPNSGPMLAVARNLRQERDREEKLQKQKQEQKNLVRNIQATWHRRGSKKGQTDFKSGKDTRCQMEIPFYMHFLASRAFYKPGTGLDLDEPFAPRGPRRPPDHERAETHIKKTQKKR